MKTLQVDGPVVTFQEVTLDALVGKEGYAVEVTSAGKIQLHASGEPIGIYEGKLIAGSPNCAVRLLTGGSIVRFIQSAAIVPGVRVKSVAGKATTAAINNDAIGIKIGSTNGAADDMISVLVFPKQVNLVGGVTIAAQTGTAAALDALTFSATVTQAEAEALRDETADIAADVLALRTALINAGVLVAP